MPEAALPVRALGRTDYVPAWQAMIDFTAARTETTPDELWVCEHPPVYTLGQAGKPEHLLADNGIPLVKIDRGGQITYHGPGQVVVYPLLDLNRRGLKVRELVGRLEQAVIDLLAEHGAAARRLDGAPGVYVDRGGDAAYPGAPSSAPGERMSAGPPPRAGCGTPAGSAISARSRGSAAGCSRIRKSIMRSRTMQRRSKASPELRALTSSRTWMACSLASVTWVTQTRPSHNGDSLQMRSSSARTAATGVR